VSPLPVMWAVASLRILGGNAASTCRPSIQLGVFKNSGPRSKSGVFKNSGPPSKIGVVKISGPTPKIGVAKISAPSWTMTTRPW